MADIVRGLLICCVFTVGVAAAGVAVAEQTYTLGMDSSVLVPEETISPDEVDGEFRITEVGLSLPGQSVTVDVIPPDEQFYVVYLRNQAGDPIENQNNLEGEQAVELNDATEEPAGSYVITVGTDADPNDILPVVIQAYRVDTATVDGDSLDESEVEANDTGNVEISLTEYEDRSIDEVELSAWQDGTGEIESVSLSETDEERTFSGSISGLEPDTYNIQFRVRGGDKVDNSEPELIGLSGNYELTVAESESTNGDDDGSQSGPSDGTSEDPGNDSPDHDDENDATDNDSDENTNNGVNDEDGQNDTDDTESHNKTGDDSDSRVEDNDTPRTTDEATGETTQSDSTDDDIISPNTTTDTETNDDLPLTAVSLVLALITLGGVIQRLTK